jgi:uncharacterized membrane protein YgcG
LHVARDLEVHSARCQRPIDRDTTKFPVPQGSSRQVLVLKSDRNQYSQRATNDQSDHLSRSAMKTIMILSGAAAAACAIALPAAAGLSGNPSFSHRIPVHVPSQAQLVQFDDHGGIVTSPADRGREPEPGDDRGVDPSDGPGEPEPGDDRGVDATETPREPEPGDDRGAMSPGEAEPSDDGDRGSGSDGPTTISSSGPGGGSDGGSSSGSSGGSGGSDGSGGSGGGHDGGRDG